MRVGLGIAAELTDPAKRRTRALESRVASLEHEHHADGDDALEVELARERRRNDVQARRIKALSALVQVMTGALLEARVLRGDQIAEELGALVEEMKPVKV